MTFEDTHAQPAPREPSQFPNRIILRSPDDSVELKQLIPEDAERYFQLIDSDRAHLSQHGEDTAIKYPTVESVRESIVHPKKPAKYRFGIWDGEIMVGSDNLTPIEGNRIESGSWIAKVHTGHHYAARARRLLVDFAFKQLHVNEIISKITIGNEPSRKSVEKSGFVYSGDIEEDGKKKWLFVLKNPSHC